MLHGGRLRQGALAAVTMAVLAGCGGATSSEPIGDAAFDTTATPAAPTERVSIGACDQTDSDGRERGDVDVRIENTSPIARNYHVTIRYYDAEGARTDSEAFAAEYDVAPGEVVKTRTGPNIGAPAGTFTCRVGRVQTIPADQAEQGDLWWDMPL